MDKYAARAVSVFLAVMALCTLFSWKLDELRTPQIVPLEAHSGLVNGQPYGHVVSNEALENGAWLLQTNSSAFQPLTVRRASPNIQASDSRNTAVDGLGQGRIVWFSDRPLSDGQVIKLWPGDASGGRVEVICGPEAEDLLREAAPRYEAQWDLSLERDRLVIANGGRFTVQQVQAVLAENEAIVLDYSWADGVLAQTNRLWLVWAGFLALILLWVLAIEEVKRGYACFRAAGRRQYPREYLAENAIGLLARLIGGMVLIFLTFAAARWVWQVRIAMPTGFLPDGSIFQPEHYRGWIARTFPEGMTSEYGAALGAALRRACLRSGGICLGLTAALAAGAVLIRKRGRGKERVRVP